MFAKFDEIPSMILEFIKEKKTLRTHGRMDGQTDHSLEGGGGGGGAGIMTIWAKSYKHFCHIQ